MPDFRFIDLAEPQEAVAALSGARRIGVDTEFMREKTYYAQLCLVQFTTGGDNWCADPLSADALGAFWDALLAPDWVLHAGRQDLEVVVQSAGKLPTALFDTQVAAALLGYPPQMGYANLVAELFDVELEKAHTRADWSRRPLPAGLLEYAAEDVAYLLRAHDELAQRLDELGRLDWAREDSNALLDESLYRVGTGTAVERVKGARSLQGRARRAAVRLAEWREQRAEAGNKPRQWILRDAVLMDIAVRNPQSPAQLAAVDNVPAGTVRRAGDDLLDLLREAENASDNYVAPERPDDAQKALLKKLQKQVAGAAKELGIAAEVLAPRRELAAAAAGERDLRVFRGWREQVCGTDLRRLLD